VYRVTSFSTPAVSVNKASRQPTIETDQFYPYHSPGVSCPWVESRDPGREFAIGEKAVVDLRHQIPIRKGVLGYKFR